MSIVRNLWLLQSLVCIGISQSKRPAVRGTSERSYGQSIGASLRNWLQESNDP